MEKIQIKSFQPALIKKLKEDRNSAEAEIAYRQQKGMKGKNELYFDHGIWIVDPIAVINVVKVAKQDLADVPQAMTI